MCTAGLEPTELVCVGGGAKADLLLQIRADVTGLPVTRPEDVETTARGAAMLAAVGAGLHGDVASAAREMRGQRAQHICFRTPNGNQPTPPRTIATATFTPRCDRCSRRRAA